MEDLGDIKKKGKEMAAKSPQTGIWGEAACGGNFGPELKRAGYDGVIITGKSRHPVILSI
ncbi:MAG: aldehyde ferredoxin oxidoreductase N-terminal domain-containing protein, partial [Halobacteriota archaeon]